MSDPTQANTRPPFREPTELRPRPDPTSHADVAYEFFHPFAHIEGRYEWCRIISPTHGAFDVFIVLGATTSEPATVYVKDDAGERFMAERYGPCTTIRVPDDDLSIGTSDDGYTVQGRIRAMDGPIREATMTFRAERGTIPRQVAYGGENAPIWGEAKRTCWGVDLVLDATVDGEIVDAANTREELRGTTGIVTMGSFGRIGPIE